jgi:PadR family transcriptional regulator, regulatory protein PadR
MVTDRATAGGDQQRLKGNLDLLLLSTVARGPAHGYAVIAALRDRSEGTFDLPEGTVYPALHRLERAQLLSARWQRGENVDGGRRRKVYVITPAGEVALATERSRWQRFTAGMGAVLNAPGAARHAPGAARHAHGAARHGQGSAAPSQGLIAR